MGTVTYIMACRVPQPKHAPTKLKRPLPSCENTFNITHRLSTWRPCVEASTNALRCRCMTWLILCNTDSHVEHSPKVYRQAFYKSLTGTCNGVPSNSVYRRSCSECRFHSSGKLLQSFCCRGGHSRCFWEKGRMPWICVPELAEESCCPPLQTPGERDRRDLLGAVLLACRRLPLLAHWPAVTLARHLQTETLVPPNSGRRTT